ncbi:UNVERIFIED_CONTAM: hypothetical protein FKN15_066213 [Acipenser sinensis]
MESDPSASGDTGQDLGALPQDLVRISETEMESYHSLLQVSSELQATLQSGRGEDSAVVITLPECSSFNEVPEDALTKVLTYLTMIPRCVATLYLPALQYHDANSIFTTAQENI